MVAMEACATAHDWGRAISGLGHDVRLVPPIYVKPFVRRQKNDAAEAIVEAASRPTTRFVALKTEEQQARSMIFRTRDLLVRQRTQLVKALRGHLAEHGIVAAHGLAQVKALATAMRDTGSLHPLVRKLGHRYLDHIARLDVEIAELDERLRRSSQDNETAKRLQSMPGMGPITAAAIEAFAPPMATFRRGRDFAAWLGLVPLAATLSSARAYRAGSATLVGNATGKVVAVSCQWRLSLNGDFDRIDTPETSFIRPRAGLGGLFGFLRANDSQDFAADPSNCGIELAHPIQALRWTSVRFSA